MCVFVRRAVVCRPIEYSASRRVASRHSRTPRWAARAAVLTVSSSLCRCTCSLPFLSRKCRFFGYIRNCNRHFDTERGACGGRGRAPAGGRTESGPVQPTAPPPSSSVVSFLSSPCRCTRSPEFDHRKMSFFWLHVPTRNAILPLERRPTSARSERGDGSPLPSSKTLAGEE